MQYWGSWDVLLMQDEYTSECVYVCVCMVCLCGGQRFTIVSQMLSTLFLMTELLISLVLPEETRLVAWFSPSGSTASASLALGLKFVPPVESGDAT